MKAKWMTGNEFLNELYNNPDKMNEFVRDGVARLESEMRESNERSKKEFFRVTI